MEWIILMLGLLIGVLIMVSIALFVRYHIRRDQNGNYLSFIRSWEIELNILARLFAKARRDRRTDGNDGYP